MPRAINASFQRLLFHRSQSWLSEALPSGPPGPTNPLLKQSPWNSSRKSTGRPQGIPKYKDKRVECGEREGEAERELEGNKAEVTAALTSFL